MTHIPAGEQHDPRAERPAARPDADHDSDHDHDQGHRSEKTDDHSSKSSEDGHGEAKKYGRFAAMILTSMVAMYFVMYLHTYVWDHVYFSETRLYMTLLMGGTMAVVMLAFMLGMYTNRRNNIAILVIAVLVFTAGLWLVRSQALVGDTSYMRAMIPHHSIAILTSERADLDDVRVQRLAEEIIEAQRREIAEMQWLLDDIDSNGVVATEAEAEARPIPEFDITVEED